MQNIEKKPLGVIDALSSGFALVVRHPWIVLLPIAFNLFLWLGPQINAKPLFDQMIVWLTASASAAAPNLMPETQQGLDASKEMLRAMGENLNILNLVAVFALGVPSLLGLETLPSDTPRAPWFVVGDPGTLIVATALFALIGIFIGSIYLETIARVVRREKGLQTFPPRVLKAYLNTGLLVGIGFLVVLIFLSPFLIGATLISLLSQGLASFVLIAGLMLVLWAALYLAFALPAVFVTGSNAVQAIWNSITVFRYNFWSAMGLIFLIYLIQMGFSLVWQELLANPWTAVFNVIANAFLGSGLIAAAMLFYFDRFTWLDEVRQRIRQQQRPLIKG
ncbi:MAG: hypothetical protein KGJ80_02490 [Chloroflexota bacterium]|nr:hypothetical protein [Chloroflexota bacterium]